VTFGRRELTAALEYVRQRAVLTSGVGSDDRPTICTTGVGCTQQGKLISSTLNVKSVHAYCMSCRITRNVFDLGHKLYVYTNRIVFIQSLLK